LSFLYFPPQSPEFDISIVREDLHVNRYVRTTADNVSFIFGQLLTAGKQSAAFGKCCACAAGRRPAVMEITSFGLGLAGMEFVAVRNIS
jgi:hypothetical protein